MSFLNVYHNCIQHSRFANFLDPGQLTTLYGQECLHKIPRFNAEKTIGEIYASFNTLCVPNEDLYWLEMNFLFTMQIPIHITVEAAN